MKVWCTTGGRKTDQKRATGVKQGAEKGHDHRVKQQFQPLANPPVPFANILCRMLNPNLRRDIPNIIQEAGELLDKIFDTDLTHIARKDQGEPKQAAKRDVMQPTRAAVLPLRLLKGHQCILWVI